MFRNAMTKVPPRGHAALICIGVTIVIVLGWKFLWLPTQIYVKAARENYRLSKMSEVGWTHYQASAAKPSSLRDDRSLSAIITQTAQEKQIAIASLTPETEKRLQLRAAPMPYTKAFEWIHLLETRFGATLIELDIHKTAEGTVDLRMTLEKPEPIKTK